MIVQPTTGLLALLCPSKVYLGLPRSHPHNNNHKCILVVQMDKADAKHKQAGPLISQRTTPQSPAETFDKDLYRDYSLGDLGQREGEMVT
jgi:hypothetical protein